MRQVSKRSKSTFIIVLALTLGALLMLGGLAFTIKSREDLKSNATTTDQSQSRLKGNDQPIENTPGNHVAPLDATQVSNSTSTATSLEYMIEEEKLAHDVYQYLYDKWGSRVFSNIIKSETSHQDEVLAVMVNRGIADPRIATVGKFDNQELQLLYDKLISQGSQSATEAFKVGVAIEELDISDLQKAISTLDPADTDVKATYEKLIAGSQNHLTAFNRQLSR